MFSKQAAMFDKLLAVGMPLKQVDVLKSILCNSSAELVHHGNLNITSQITTTDLRPSRWAVCTHNWEYDGDPPSKGGGIGYVYAQECDNAQGTGASGGHKKIYLPVSSGLDPNLEAGDVIAYSRTDSGEYVGLGYGDNRIGSIIMGTQGQEVFPGYALCDGTKNAVSASKGSGSAINLATRFPRCWSSASDSGTTGGGGSSTISIAGTLSIAGTISATGIGNHSHELSTSSIAEGDGSMGTVGVVTGSNTADEGIDLGTISVAFTGGGGSGSPSVTFTGGGGSGSPTVDAIPPFAYVAFMERLDNSRNITGR
tara:strand:- start:607 stop:1542 length:936 start_codon:yes stop_codon:yes gene_type:complete